MAKNLSNSPFEDQTKQMLTLRENVRSILNDHRRFQEMHKRLINCETHINVFLKNNFNQKIRKKFFIE